MPKYLIYEFGNWDKYSFDVLFEVKKLEWLSNYLEKCGYENEFVLKYNPKEKLHKCFIETKNDLPADLLNSSVIVNDVYFKNIRKIEEETVGML